MPENILNSVSYSFFKESKNDKILGTKIVFSLCKINSKQEVQSMWLDIDKKVKINDKGYIEVLGPDNKYYRTNYSNDFMKILKKFRSGYYIWEELLRSEYPFYLYKRIEEIMKFLNLGKDIRILDFGGGAGASASVLVKLGYKNIITVDNTNYRELYESRLIANGLYEPSFLQVNIFNYNPPEPFDMIICSGVFEHLNPYHRRDVTNYLFGILKKNGFFVVFGTPTIYSPRNSHCGWFYDWLPFSVSFALLKRKFKDRISKYTSDTEILNSGVCFRGVSISEITPEKENFEIVELPETIIKLEILYPRCKPIKELSKIRKFLFIFVKVLKFFIPIYYLLPHYSLVIRKL